ncbi:MAG: putative toxin-antitoxin system toxin component, PIN family [Panacibacter sp.]
MRNSRFVLDNNIWVSYFITNSQQRIIEIIDFYEIAVFSCDELMEEFRTVLKYERLQKFNVNIPKAVKLLKEITTHFTITYPIKNYIPADADDNYVIALALQTNSGFVTSGDSHILSQKETLEARYHKLKIINKAEFENRFPLEKK